MNSMDSTIRKGRKFDQVLRGARSVFLRDGFEGASVDDIARSSGVSKATLYSYFPDKRLLFVEVARTECTRMADQALNLVDDDGPVEEALLVAATQLVGFLLSDFAQGVFRICLAERDRFPELGEAFYLAGPEMGRERLSAFLACAEARGALVIEDMDMAAEQFAELCKARLWTRAALGLQSEFTQDEIDHVARNAVATFMARYGACSDQAVMGRGA